MRINIRAIEKQMPQNCLHSHEMDKLSNGVSGRIEKHTGVQYRYHISGNESVCSLGAAALKKTLKSAAMDVSEIDLLIFSGASFDYPVPHNAAVIKSMIADDSVNFHCLDVNSTCLSFLNALDIANIYLQTKRYKKIAIVCSEVSSRALTPRDEMVFGLFGDAAVAMIIEQSEKDGYSQSYVDFINYPSGSLLAHVPIGGAINRGIDSDSSDLGYYFKMNGKALFRLTTKHLDKFVSRMEKQTGIKIETFEKIIPHQTSRMGNSYLMDYYKLKPDQVVETLSNYGNCISASIPLGLEKYYNEQRKAGNHNVLLFGSGAGVSIGAIVLNFNA
jgi:3-oxoacyl-[acyl-carrier-protein] synthase-3